MRKFLIATHGSFAAGIKSSLEMIIGSTENVYAIQAYTEGNKTITEDLNQIMQKVSDDDELIIFTDLAGGSITNQVLQTALKKNIYIIAGVNLPLLLDIVLSDPEAPISEVIETGISNARNQIVFVNEMIGLMREE
jgi:fructoselysine and glucoselysine-specific PTS system IIA component